MGVVIPLTVKITYDKASSDAPFVAYNPELDLTSCGPTEEKARMNLRETVDIVLKEVKKKKKLDEFLQEMGFEKLRKGWHPPRITFEPFVFPQAS